MTLRLLCKFLFIFKYKTTNTPLISLKVACMKSVKVFTKSCDNQSAQRFKIEDCWIRPNAAKRPVKSKIDTLRYESGEKCGGGIFDIPIVACRERQRTGKQIVWFKINRHLIYSHARTAASCAPKRPERIYSYTGICIRCISSVYTKFYFSHIIYLEMLIITIMILSKCQ